MATDLVNLCNINARSLSNDKIDAIRAEIISDHDVLILTETHLPYADVDNENLALEGFGDIIRKDRGVRMGGGVAVYVAEHIGAVKMTEFEIEDLEAMWVKLKVGSNIMFLCACYTPISNADFWIKLQESIDLVKESGNHDIIIAGDLNADPDTRNGQLMKLFAESNNFSVHVEEPTRITKDKASILDQYISNMSWAIRKLNVLDPISTCDHCPVSVSLKLKNSYSKPKAYTRHIWQYHLADFDEFRKQLSEADWDSCFNHDDINKVCKTWTDLFLNTARNCIPNKVITVRPSDKLFFNAELRRLRRKKNRFHRIAKRSNTLQDWENFRKMRNDYNNKIKEAKLKSEKSRADQLQDRETLSPKKWWRLAKSFLKKDQGNTSYPALKVDNDLICDDKEKADTFNNFFLKSAKIDDTNVPRPDFTCTVENRLSQVIVNEKDIIDLLKSLDITKATGPDQISHVMLKKAGDVISPSLSRIFNLSLTSAKYPVLWKEANVVPIHKKNDNAITDNYRPVSLLSCVGKLFERVVFKYVFNFLRDNNAITLKQSGFMPGDSTVYQLTHLYHLFSEAIDKQKSVRIVFCDISKAFDRVWHTGLLAKLSKIGITGNLLNWFQDYLTERKQRVVINGQASEWGTIEAGVPQGSVLGPLLFLIYINDLTYEVQSSEVRLFADDTILYIIVDNPKDSVDSLNNDLSRVSNWASDWIVKFSAPKTKTMLVSNKHPDDLPPVSMDGVNLDEVQSHKHLGVVLSKDLSWKNHIEDMVSRASKCLDVLHALKYKLDRQTLEKLYLAFIRSKLEYAAVLWDNCNDELSEMIERVQYRAGKIISGAIHRTSKEIVYSELGWESLKLRRKKARLKMMYKTVNLETPSYLTNTLPQQQPRRYELRNNTHVPNIRGRTITFDKTFFPKSIREWNELPDDIKNAPSFESFCGRLNNDRDKPPIWFYSGDRKLSIFHARMRMLCSPLSDHLYSFIHVLESPRCECGYARENNKHFLLQCPLYTNERIVMLNSLIDLEYNPILRNLLYGSDEYDEEKNKQAFSVIQTFIKNTGRFD